MKTLGKCLDSTFVSETRVWWTSESSLSPAFGLGYSSLGLGSGCSIASLLPIFEGQVLLQGSLDWVPRKMQYDICTMLHCCLRVWIKHTQASGWGFPCVVRLSFSKFVSQNIAPFILWFFGHPTRDDSILRWHFKKKLFPNMGGSFSYHQIFWKQDWKSSLRPRDNQIWIWNPRKMVE